MALAVEGEAADAQIFVAAPLGEAAVVGIEDRNAAVGRHIEDAAGGIDGNRDGDAVAEAIEHRPRRGVEQQQRAAAGRRPQPSLAAAGPVEHRHLELGPRHARSVARSAGNECVSTGGSRWSPYLYKKIYHNRIN